MQKKEDKASVIINNYGGNNQILPNATTAVQISFGGDDDANFHSPLDPYIHDIAVRKVYLQRIVSCPSATALCQNVLADLYHDEFADRVDGDKLIKSREFLSAIIPLLTFESGKSIRNLQNLIDQYVFGKKIEINKNRRPATDNQ